ncbi:MAG: hypothetical protein IE885_01865 [Campylobacterales bacterium]|nr:hypothetical protein [Campylobacterales bacterium]
MKKSLLFIPFFMTYMQANIQDDRAEMMRVDTELFIVHKQKYCLKRNLQKNKRNTSTTAVSKRMKI